MDNTEQTTQPNKQSSMWISLLFNIAIPFFILSKFANAQYLGEVRGLLIALAFPAGYFVYEWVTRHKVSFIAILGFAGLLLKGAIGLLNLPREYVAYERFAVPALIGLAVLISTWTKWPLVNKMLYNRQVLDVDHIDAKVQERGEQKAFQKMFRNTSFLLAGSFFFSAVINYFVTSHLMGDLSISYPEALANVIKWSLLIVTVPLMIIMVFIIFYLFRSLSRITGEEMEQLYSPALRKMDKKDKKE